MDIDDETNQNETKRNETKQRRMGIISKFIAPAKPSPFFLPLLFFTYPRGARQHIRGDLNGWQRENNASGIVGRTQTDS